MLERKTPSHKEENRRSLELSYKRVAMTIVPITISNGKVKVKEKGKVTPTKDASKAIVLKVD